jgi:hypothetical protein
MYAYLEEIYHRTRSDDFGSLLGGMSLLEDGKTADPAAWEDWLRAVERAKSGDVNLELGLQ